jgi:ribonuclease P protein component
MLKRENRLSKIIRRAGEKKYFSPLFHVKISENKENKARFGFVVSKKIDKRAVVRNKTKRVLRDTAKELIDSVLGKDIVIIAKKSLSPKDREEVAKELGNILNK